MTTPMQIKAITESALDARGWLKGRTLDELGVFITDQTQESAVFDIEMTLDGGHRTTMQGEYFFATGHLVFRSSELSFPKQDVTEEIDIRCPWCGNNILYHRRDDADFYVTILPNGDLDEDVGEKLNGYSAFECEDDFCNKSRNLPDELVEWLDWNMLAGCEDLF